MLKLNDSAALRQNQHVTRSLDAADFFRLSVWLACFPWSVQHDAKEGKRGGGREHATDALNWKRWRRIGGMS
jgi:hypothetical protein